MSGKRITGGADAQQRGDAAQIRQMDDNRNRQMLSREDRKFVNTVIHDKSEGHNDKFDEKLDSMNKRYLNK